MNNYLNRIFCREKLTFLLSREEKNHINKRLQKITDTKGYSVNLTGKIKDENQFKLTDKITIGVYIQGGGDPAVLRGKFTEESGNILLTIKVNSHFVFSLGSILIPIFLIATIISNYSELKDEAYYSFIFILVVAFIINMGGNFFKNRLLKKTLKELKLKE
ncbi:hypothetical protein [Marinifilum flexuosum]|uniref:hypothetical protein n=1 Tax=Marinifilum flexuosum TaxID=1117708 RepID=UPI002494025C|nr:hypothetical protein [Marinifilum flexuosum]